MPKNIDNSRIYRHFKHLNKADGSASTTYKLITDTLPSLYYEGNTKVLKFPDIIIQEGESFEDMGIVEAISVIDGPEYLITFKE